MPKKKHNNKKKNKKKSTSSWNCPNCTHPNPLSQSYCSMCGDLKDPSSSSTTSSSSSTTTNKLTPRNYQQEALKKYNDLHSQTQEMTASHPDPTNDPMFTQLLKISQDKLSVYKEESDKKDQDRNIPAKGMSMPRPVLRVMSNYYSMTQIYKAMECQIPSIPKHSGTGYAQLRLMKYVDENSSPFETGFGICFMPNSSSISKPIQLCHVKPWIKAMGKWDARTWGFFLASCLFKCGIGQVDAINCTHKLQDNPNLIHPEVFPRAIAAEFRDIIKADRFKHQLDGVMYAKFGADQDMGMLLNDLALHFDRRIYKVAIELGIPNVEDRSKTPALSYIIGQPNKDGTPKLIPQDCFGRFWPNQKSYIQERLGRSSEAEKYFPFIMDLLNAQKVKEDIDRGCGGGGIRTTFFDKVKVGTNKNKIKKVKKKNNDDVVTKEDYDDALKTINTLQTTAQNGMDFVNKRLPKLVKKLCQKYNYPVPMIYRVKGNETETNSMFVSSVAQEVGILTNTDRKMDKGSGSIKCCLHCGALKGMEGSTALLKCPCKMVYFCSVACQKQCWKAHKKTCSAVKVKKKKKN